MKYSLRIKRETLKNEQWLKDSLRTNKEDFQNTKTSNKILWALMEKTPKRQNFERFSED